jgi:hypothetical protein
MRPKEREKLGLSCTYVNATGRTGYFPPVEHKSRATIDVTARDRRQAYAVTTPITK